MQHAKIFSSSEKCMKGVELKRLRKGAGLSLAELGDKMYDWGWDAKKVWRFQRKSVNYFDPNEMADLLTSLDATSL